MRVSLVMTVIGDDRPGLVESVSQVVAAHGGSWQESHMARLAGKFAGILRAEVPEDKVDALEAELRELASGGIHIIVEPGYEEVLSEARSLRLENVTITEDVNFEMMFVSFEHLKPLFQHCIQCGS